MKPKTIDKWETYVPEGKLDGIRKLLATPLTTPLPPATQATIKATTDTTWLAMNEGTQRMMENTSVRPDAANTIGITHAQDKRRVSKKVTINSKKRQDSPTVKMEEEDDRPHKMLVVPPVAMLDTLPIEDLEQHHTRDNQLALFALNMERQSRSSTDFVINTPPAVDVLAYCAQYKDAAPWYAPMVNAVAASQQYSFPDIPVLRHSVLRTFLRVPTGGERPCFNLDREPMAHERVVRCIAHRMSEERLGAGKGFRLRELILTSNEAMGKIPEYCYLCHLWTYLQASIEQRDKATQRNASSSSARSFKCINKFMVIVDTPGEYDLNKMLTCDKVSAGIWGPVPLFNENNYVVSTTPVSEGSLPCFIETENLFWLTRVSLPLIESSSKRSSNRSGHTLAASASSNLHH